MIPVLRIQAVVVEMIILLRIQAFSAGRRKTKDAFWEERWEEVALDACNCIWTSVTAAVFPGLRGLLN